MTLTCRSLAVLVSGGCEDVEESILIPLSGADGHGIMWIARNTGMKRCGVVTCRRDGSGGGGWNLCVKSFVAPVVGTPSPSFFVACKIFSVCCYWSAYCGSDPMHLFRVFRPFSPSDEEKPYQFSNFVHGSLPKEGWAELMSAAFFPETINASADGDEITTPFLPFHEHAWLDHGGWIQLHAFHLARATGSRSLLLVFHRVQGAGHQQQLVVFIRDMFVAVGSS